ncbi:ExbD/TolR family protein [Azorhizobium oxalatiphilum]|nr:biopolymer transporter ExbD [Azorhizobium oxalatiphilum]
MLTGLVALSLAHASVALASMATPGASAASGSLNAQTPVLSDLAAPQALLLVAAPLLTAGVPVELPSTPVAAASRTAIVLTVNDKGQIFIAEHEVKPEELEARLLAVAGNDREERIIVRADKRVDYKTVMQVMERLSAAGFKRVGLLSEMEKGG